MARATRLASLVAAIVLFQGCGGPPATPAPGATPSPAISAQPSPTASAAPAPSPTSDLGALVANYSAIALKTNAARAQCSTDADAASANLASAKVAARKCLDDFRAVDADFKAVDWGPVQAQANRVVAAIDLLETLADQMANAATVAAFRAAYAQVLPAAATLLSRSDELQAALGIPPS